MVEPIQSFDSSLGTETASSLYRTISGFPARCGFSHGKKVLKAGFAATGDRVSVMRAVAGELGRTSVSLEACS